MVIESKQQKKKNEVIKNRDKRKAKVMEHKSAVPVASKQSQSEGASKCQVRRGKDTENVQKGKRKKTKYRHRKPKKDEFVDMPNDTDCKCM